MGVHIYTAVRKHICYCKQKIYIYIYISWWCRAPLRTETIWERYAPQLREALYLAQHQIAHKGSRPKAGRSPILRVKDDTREGEREMEEAQ